MSNGLCFVYRKPKKLSQQSRTIMRCLHYRRPRNFLIYDREFENPKEKQMEEQKIPYSGPIFPQNLLFLEKKSCINNSSVDTFRTFQVEWGGKILKPVISSGSQIPVIKSSIVSNCWILNGVALPKGIKHVSVFPPYFFTLSNTSHQH
ncbi:hypothetical protein NPIL_436711 [Nephila pilipes]|uniref:Uncharacterized protein n=1 Tax=Nephila pilipes TaxID=299642 RepID=A0A8X6NCE5_NEPPI|nr:hypothetical protein NPIL_436711 [Nephila pilipes]